MTFPASKPPSRSAPAWRTGAVRIPRDWRLNTLPNTSLTVMVMRQARNTVPTIQPTTTQEPSDAGDDGGNAVGTCADEFDEQFYIDRLLQHDRTGFIWQKLKEPRSYDFAKARNKDSFNDRLRMPLFPLDDREREAVITFVLGLVAEPPAYEFVYHPDAEKQALIAGHKALTKFNCVGCHIVDPETWTLEVPSWCL